MKARVNKPKRLPRLDPREVEADSSSPLEPEPVKGFGILRDKPVDGLAYQKRMRDEWKGR